MNTNVITLTEILGTDSVAGSRITINKNFSKLVTAVSDIQTRIDTSKNTLYINAIEAESGEFVVKTTMNHTVRFRINNAGEIYIGNTLLDDYIREVVQNTNYVDISIFDEGDNAMNWKEETNIITVYYEDEESFVVHLSIPESVIDLYKHPGIIIYKNGELVTNESLLNYVELNEDTECYEGDITFTISENNEDSQKSITIVWIPETCIQETYAFELSKLNN